MLGRPVESMSSRPSFPRTRVKRFRSRGALLAKGRAAPTRLSWQIRRLRSLDWILFTCETCQLNAAIMHFAQQGRRSKLAAARTWKRRWRKLMPWIVNLVRISTLFLKQIAHLRETDSESCMSSWVVAATPMPTTSYAATTSPARCVGHRGRS